MNGAFIFYDSFCYYYTNGVNSTHQVEEAYTFINADNCVPF